MIKTWGDLDFGGKCELLRGNLEVAVADSLRFAKRRSFAERTTTLL
jgi:hypothetical protein